VGGVKQVSIRKVDKEGEGEGEDIHLIWSYTKGEGDRDVTTEWCEATPTHQEKRNPSIRKAGEKRSQLDQ